jgi:hypothetical protein
MFTQLKFLIFGYVVLSSVYKFFSQIEKYISGPMIYVITNWVDIT